jgi:hypothetical protein
MGHFHQDYHSASADLVEYYGRPVFYFDRSLTEPVTVTAKVYRERATRRQNDFGWYWARVRTVELLECQQEVRSDGTVTIDEADYSIDAVSAKESNRTIVELVRVQAGEITRPGYRGN